MNLGEKRIERREYPLRQPARVPVQEPARREQPAEAPVYVPDWPVRKPEEAPVR